MDLEDIVAAGLENHNPVLTEERLELCRAMLAPFFHPEAKKALAFMKARAADGKKPQNVGLKKSRKKRRHVRFVSRAGNVYSACFKNPAYAGLFGDMTRLRARKNSHSSEYNAPLIYSAKLRALLPTVDKNRFDQAAGTLARLYNAAEEGELYDDWVQAEEREEDLVEVAEEIEDLVTQVEDITHDKNVAMDMVFTASQTNAALVDDIFGKDVLLEEKDVLLDEIASKLSEKECQLAESTSKLAHERYKNTVLLQENTVLKVDIERLGGPIPDSAIMTHMVWIMAVHAAMLTISLVASLAS